MLKDASISLFHRNPTWETDQREGGGSKEELQTTLGRTHPAPTSVSPAGGKGKANTHSNSALQKQLKHGVFTHRKVRREEVPRETIPSRKRDPSSLGDLKSLELTGNVTCRQA